MEIKIKVVNKELDLASCTNILETSKTYMVVEEVPRKDAMHQIKDIVDSHCKIQLIFYLQNLPFIAKEEDMSCKNYSSFWVIREGGKIIWAAIYL